MRNLQMLVGAPRAGVSRLRQRLRALVTDDGPGDSGLSLPPEGVDSSRAEPRLDAPPLAASASHAGSTGLAVCPYCHTVWQLEPIFPEPVKLMICWRCAEQRAELGRQMPAIPEPAPITFDKPASRSKVIVTYGALLVIGLTLGFAAMQAWFSGGALRSPRTTGGVVSATPAVEQARTPAEAAEAAPAAPLPEPSSAVPLPDEPVAAGRPVRPAKATTGLAAVKEVPRPMPPAQAPSETACTSGTSALGLCTLDTPEERRSP
jgi:hypothetical protein